MLLTIANSPFVWSAATLARAVRGYVSWLLAGKLRGNVHVTEARNQPRLGLLLFSFSARRKDPGQEEKG